MSEMQKPFRTLWRFEPGLNNRVVNRDMVACNGKLFVIGGNQGGNSNDYSYHMEVFDPETNIWGTTAGPSDSSLRFGSNTKADIYEKTIVVAGQEVDKLWMLDTTTNTWSSSPQIPTVRKQYILTVFGGKVYVIGGMHGNSYTYSTDVYNLDTGVWETPLRFNFSNYSVGHKAFVVGEQLYLALDRIFYIYNCVDGNLTSLPSPPWERNAGGGSYIVLGTEVYCFPVEVAYQGRGFYIFDTVAQTFTAGEERPINWYNNRSAVLNERVYLIGEDSTCPKDMISISVEALTTGEETNPEEGEDMYMTVRMKDTSLLSGTYDPQNPGSWQPGKTLFNI